MSATYVHFVSNMLLFPKRYQRSKRIFTTMTSGLLIFLALTPGPSTILSLQLRDLTTTHYNKSPSSVFLHMSLFVLLSPKLDATTYSFFVQRLFLMYLSKRCFFTPFFRFHAAWQATCQLLLWHVREIRHSAKSSANTKGEIIVYLSYDSNLSQTRKHRFSRVTRYCKARSCYFL